VTSCGSEFSLSAVPTTTTAPSLRLLVPSGFLRRFQLVQLHQVVPFRRGPDHSILSTS
jgi:hypothetical protein